MITEASRVPVTVALVTFKVVAVIAPEIVAFVATKAPASETLKGALPKVLLPRCIPVAVDNEILDVPLPAIKLLEPTVNPPITPVVAAILPAIFKADPSHLKKLELLPILNLAVPPSLPSQKPAALLE